jgi:hypothetical protein
VRQRLTLRSNTISQFVARLAAMTLSQALAAQEELADKAGRLESLGQEHDDFTIAKGWFVRLRTELPTPEERLRRSGERASHMYEKAIDRVTKIANSRRYMSPAIKDLCERNRAARRAG